MALSTKNIPMTTGNLSKTLKPGNCLAKINSISLEKDRLKEDSYYVILQLEGPDLGEGFEGFWLDPEDQSKGRHKGQVGRVQVGNVSAKGGLFPFQDGKVGEKPINRDQEILRFINSLAVELNKVDDVANVEEETVELYIPKVSVILCGGEEKFIHFCLGGREWMKGNYIQYALFLPRADFNNKKFAVAADEANLLKFNDEVHIIKKKGAKATEAGEATSFEPPAGEFTL